MLWRQMEENMGSTRTWQSLKEHFLKKVLPNIESYHLSCERVRAFRERKPSRSSMAPPCQINGKLYTLKEDKELIKRVLAKVRRFPIRGVLIWKKISSQGSFKNGKRSWQSLKTRFIKYIQPNLSNYTMKEEERNLLEQRSFRSESSVTATTKQNLQVSVPTNSATTNTDAAHPVDIKRPQLVTRRKLHYIDKNVSASPYVALDVRHSPIVSRALFRGTDQPDRGMNNRAHSNSNADVSVESARCVATTTRVDENYELHKGPILKQSIGTQTFISGDLCPRCYRMPDDHQTQNSAVDVPNRDIDLVSVLEGTEFTVPVFTTIIGNRNANVLINTRSVSEPTSNNHSEISHSTVEDRTNNVHEDVITIERKDKLNTNSLGNDSIPSSFHCDRNRTLETFSNPLSETIHDMNPLNVDNCWEQVTFKHISKKFVASIKEKSCGKKNRIVTRQFVEPSRDSETCENIRPSRVKCNTFRNRLVKNCEELLKSSTELELQCSGGRVHQKDLPSSSPNIAEFDLTQDEVLEIQASYNSAQDMEDLPESPIPPPKSPTPPPESPTPPPESPIPPPESAIPPPESPTPPPESSIPPSESAIPHPGSPIPRPKSPIPPESAIPPPKTPIPPPESPIPPPESAILLPESPIPSPESPLAPTESSISPPDSPIAPSVPPPESAIPPPESPISPDLTTPHFKNLSPDTSGTCSSYELHHLSSSDPSWLDTGDLRDVLTQ